MNILIDPFVMAVAGMIITLLITIIGYLINASLLNIKTRLSEIDARIAESFKFNHRIETRVTVLEEYRRIHGN